VLFVGDDWAEDHHDVELVDDAGRRLARARLPEGLEGLCRLHALVAEHSPEDWADLPPEEAARRVVIGIETDRGSWVQALLAAGYVVFAINPMQVARYRERHSTVAKRPGRRPRDEGRRSRIWLPRPRDRHISRFPALSSARSAIAARTPSMRVRLRWHEDHRDAPSARSPRGSVAFGRAWGRAANVLEGRVVSR
jgi:hypothetical protein